MKDLFEKFLVVIVALFLLSPVVTVASDEGSKKGDVQQKAVNEENWEELNLQVISLYKEQKFMKASGLNKFVITLARKLPEAEKEKLATSLGNMSMIATHLGKFMDAEQSAWEELAILQKIHGKNAIKVIKAWNHLAMIYTMAQEPKDAEQCLKTIINIEEKYFGNKDPRTLPSYKKLLKFYQITKNSKAEKDLATRLKKMEKERQKK